MLSFSMLIEEYFDVLQITGNTSICYSFWAMSHNLHIFFHYAYCTVIIN